MLKMRSIKSANYYGYKHDSSGYLKKCCNCGKVIYMLQLDTGKFIPFESWEAGNCEKGEWIAHQCNYDKKTDSNNPKRKNVIRKVITHNYCPRCHLELPLASKICDYCGYNYHHNPYAKG